MEFNERPAQQRKFAAVLSFDAARLDVRIGVTAEERAKPQPIDLSVRVGFLEAPPGCQTDQLSDTVCYEKLVLRARKYIQKKEFFLIERLAFELHQDLHSAIVGDAELWLSVQKIHPPVENLAGGVRFAYGCPEFGSV